MLSDYQADRPLMIWRAAHGKRMDGTVSAAGGFVESHSARECIEQTKKPGI
jgi:hypothetical protein